MFGLIAIGFVVWVAVSLLVSLVAGQAISHHMNATAHDMPEGE